MTRKQVPTEASVEAVLSRQHELSESTKDNIKSRVTSALQSASLPNRNLTPDEQKALKRLKTDKKIVVLPADKGRVTVIMDKTDYNDKMDALGTGKHTYELKHEFIVIIFLSLNNFKKVLLSNALLFALQGRKKKQDWYRWHLQIVILENITQDLVMSNFLKN